MASIILAIPVKTWVQIDGSSGSIYHKSGGEVVYTESATNPGSFSETTPISKTSNKGEDFPFYGVASTEYLWCYCINGEATITVSPDEV